MLIEAGPRVLAGFPDELSAYAQRSLEGSASRSCSAARHRMHCRRRGLWRQAAAGRNHHLGRRRAASPAAEWLGAPADRAGRMKVEPDLTVPGHPEIFAIGDTVAIDGPDGKPVPGIAPAAKQQGGYVADAIRARLRGDTLRPVPLQACRRPRADRQAQGGDRFRLDQAERHGSPGGSGASPTSIS